VRPRDQGHAGLVPQSEFLDDLTVPVDICALHVIEKATTLTVHLEEPTASVVILFVHPKVFRQVLDALAEKRDLYASRAAVRLMGAVFLDGGAFFESHCPEVFPPQVAATFSVIFSLAK
jgi:hypothetical protein